MEQDPVKYDSYELAICQAMMAFKNNNNNNNNNNNRMTVVVVGAGRGPLVQASLNASVITGVGAEVIIIIIVVVFCCWLAFLLLLLLLL